jgi:hypothetical protein
MAGLTGMPLSFPASGHARKLWGRLPFRNPLCLLLLLPALSGQQAPAPPEKCTFAGVVQDSVTGQRLSRAQVSLRSTTPGKGMYGATADSTGAFRFEAVEAGDYNALATESDHAFTGALFLEPGKAISVVHFTAGQSIAGAVFKVDPKATVTGHITDADGDPIAGAQVGLIREQWMRGRPEYMAMVVATGERGEYRFAVMSGRYFVTAGLLANGAVPTVFSEGPGKPEMRVARMVYPDSPSIEGATALEVRPGQQYGGIDLRLPTVVVYHVRGAVRPWGSWIGPKALSLTLRGGGPSYLDSTLPIDKDGGFEVAGVPPGSYWLQSLPMSMAGIRVPVEVTDRDVDGVVFTAVPPVDIMGHLHFEEDGPHDLSKMRIQVMRLDSGHPLGRVEADVLGGDGLAEPRSDGTFVFNRLAAAETALELIPPGDYYLQSATFNRREVENGRLDLTSGVSGELDIVVGSGTGTVSGTVHDLAGSAVAVLAPATGVTGNTGVRSAAIDQNGRFQFPFVPPGRYYVWAVARYDWDHWQNMDFVTQMQERGVAVELEKKGSAQVEVPAVIQ